MTDATNCAATTRPSGTSRSSWRWARPAAAASSSPTPRTRSRAKSAMPERWCPPRMRRSAPPVLPEMSEPDVLRHYLHLSQETLGHDRHQPLRHLHDEIQSARQRGRRAARRSRSCTRCRTRRRCRASWRSSTNFDLMLRELSGMDRFVFQAGRRRRRRLHACLRHARLARRARRARAARRDRHLHPGASLQSRDRRQPPASRS